MTTRHTNAIRETIALAQHHEQTTNQLRNLLNTSIDQLHQAIDLPEDDSCGALHKFVLRYIEHAPDFLDAVYEMAQQAEIDSQIKPLLLIAEDYFLTPPEIMDGHSGLDALMDQAYLAHRFIEEVNDRFIGSCGVPLAPMDTTRANIIIHHLIGEPFANELDAAVQHSAEQLINKELFNNNQQLKSYLDQHKAHGWTKELDRWPCLAENLAISLEFNRNSSITELLH